MTGPTPHFSEDLRHLTERAAARRGALRWLGAAGLASTGLAACGGTADAGAPLTPPTSPGSANTAACTATPTETAGPYPGDGSNSNGAALANALALSGIVRKDVRSSTNSTVVATGLPLTINLQVVRGSGSCAPAGDLAVYIWHCDAFGRYSMYSSGVTQETYLRGVQVTDAQGQVSFQTIVPGCYAGRWPHVHFEVFENLAAATRGANSIKTSQLALPQDMCQAVYALSGYPNSASNLANVALSRDTVFSDGYSTQLATVSGSATAGYTASLRVVV